jgi:hypothetical protein
MLRIGRQKTRFASWFLKRTFVNFYHWDYNPAILINQVEALMFSRRANARRWLLWSSALVGVLLFTTPTPSQVREVPQPGGRGIHTPLPRNNPGNNPGLHPGVGLTGPGLGPVRGYPGGAGVSGGSSSGGSSTPYTPDAMSPRVQAVLDQLFQEKLNQLPAVEKSKRNRP